MRRAGDRCPVDLMPVIPWLAKLWQAVYRQQSRMTGRAGVIIMGQSPIQAGLTKVGLPRSKKATATREKLGYPPAGTMSGQQSLPLQHVPIELTSA